MFEPFGNDGAWSFGVAAKENLEVLRRIRDGDGARLIGDTVSPSLSRDF